MDMLLIHLVPSILGDHTHTHTHTQLGQITRNGKENGQSGWEQHLSAPLSPADLEEMDRYRVKINGIGEYTKES